MTADTNAQTAGTQPDEIPFFPAPAPAALADPGTARAMLLPVLDDLAAVVAAIGDDDLARPTPCRDYDVAGLRDHVLGWLDLFGAAFADPARATTRPDPEQFHAADLPTAAFPAPQDVVRTAAGRLDRALADGVLDGDVVMSQARMTGPAALGMILGEYVVHGWDLATATGRAWTPPQDAVTVAHEFFGGVVAPEYRGPDGGFFDAEVEVPDDAPALDRLLGFAGRDPRWTPAA
ncbi:TIGR03086 family metal-binding protein [Kineosporia sp. R_H_3]|uniref:TIGR03086 family metal-binding protein n=1 Tax=Kineosporia sp. R_H_3 TaxID=1961848 RepID=UPI000B4AD3B6|nr:TIGR03086 family metal-binding protein [Kineosporia sp. R_H_3]